MRMGGPMPNPTAELIAELLDNALDNGYDFRDTNPFLVAEDMIQCSDQVEDCEPEVLLDGIMAWQESKKIEKSA